MAVNFVGESPLAEFCFRITQYYYLRSSALIQNIFAKTATDSLQTGCRFIYSSSYKKNRTLLNISNYYRFSSQNSNDESKFTFSHTILYVSIDINKPQ